MIVKSIILSIFCLLLLTMANPLGEEQTDDGAEKNVTSKELCADYQIIDIDGNCKNATERFFDIDIDVDCSNENEIRNTHGNCIDKESIIIFDD